MSDVDLSRIGRELDALNRWAKERVTVTLDDGTKLELSRAEARRAHDAYNLAVLDEGLKDGGVHVVRCGGPSKCQSCAKAAGRRG